MKICPFISHMIGDNGTNVLEAAPGAADPSSEPNSTEESDVVILGYDDGNVVLKSQTVQAKSKAKVQPASNDGQSHLFCLKDSCRFYQKPGGECMFDSIFETVTTHRRDTNQAATRSSGAGEAAEVTKELDKFWKFQTKSVSELISSIGEHEKKQEKSIEGLRKDLEGQLQGLNSGGGNDKGNGDVSKEIAKLNEALKERDEGLENFSTSVSELVMNIEDSLVSLRKESESISSRIGDLGKSAPDTKGLEERIEGSIKRHLERLSGSDMSGELRSLAEQVKEFIGSTKHFEERFDSWQGKMESRVDEIQKKQAETLDVMEAHSRTPAAASVAPARNRSEAKKMNNLGVTSFHNGDLEMARDHFLRAVKLDDEFAEAYNNLGLVHTEIGQSTEAADAFNRAIDINPNLHAAYNNLGYAFYRQGDYEQAVGMYNEALERSEGNSSAYTNLGNAYYKMARRDDAREAWERALDLDPGNEKASRNIKRLEHE